MANVLGELFGDIASAIREKTGDAEKMKPAEFPEKISAIETGADVSAVTAEAEDVMEGKTIVDASGNPVAGAMVNHGSVLKNLYFYENYPQNTYTIPKGYHDGTGKVKAEYSAKTITPTKNEQTVRGNRVGQGAPIIYDFLGKVTVKPIPDKYQDVTPVTATAEDVRAGKVFVDAQGNAVEGALSGTIADVSGVTATAADVRQGKVIVDAQGNEVVGTLVVEQKAPDVIWVGKDSVSNALVGTGVVRYVTFMNDDGTAVYGRKSVLVGTDCIEPVAGGYMDAPTKESTAQYNYTFSGGWATEPGGGINADALKNVTEDRTVYANFIAAVRYYTITYYDSDGTTVLKTESLAYGATPSYAPENDGYMFTGWTPELTTVTGNASYTAGWMESIAFADASWATIAEKSADGTASLVWSVGDTKNLTLTNGEVVPVQIAGFNHDTLASGGGKAGITLISAKLLKDVTCDISVALGGYDTLLANLIPTEVARVAKKVNKQREPSLWMSDPIETTEIKFWAPSLHEGGRNGSEIAPGAYANMFWVLGEAYQLFAQTPIRNITDTSGASADYWTRNYTHGSNYCGCIIRSAPKNGNIFIDTASSRYNTKKIRFGFCI